MWFSEKMNCEHEITIFPVLLSQAPIPSVSPKKENNFSLPYAPISQELLYPALCSSYFSFHFPTKILDNTKHLTHFKSCHEV